MPQNDVHQVIQSYAPGRVEVLGNHTDYNLGFVLSMAINRGTQIEGSRRNDSKIILHSSIMGESYRGDIDALAPSENTRWVNYILGVLHEIKSAGHSLGGFEASISSSLPISAGLSSSAALTVSTSAFLNEAFNLNLSKLEMAKIAQSAEHKYAKVRCGLLDPLSSLFGKKNSLSFIDFKSIEVKNISLPETVVFVIADTGKKHDLSNEYNERREGCENAAKKLGITSLRETSKQMLLDARDRLTSTEYDFALHIVGENERTLQGVKALKEHDLKKFGELLLESHQSSQKYFRNSAPELDQLVDLAASCKGCFGARLSGGGFGGATISLVQADKAEFLIAEINKAHPGTPTFITHAEEGAHSSVKN